MSASQPIPSRAVRRLGAPVLQPQALFSWQARFASLDALTGQTGTLTRASTAGTIASDDAGPVLVGYGDPRWYSYPNWEASDDPRVTGLIAQSEHVEWPLEFVPQSFTVIVEGINTNGATPINGGGILHLGNAAATPAQLSIVGTATTYQLALQTAGGTVTSTLSTAVGDVRWRILAQMEDNGTTQRIRLGISVTEAAFAWDAWSSTLARAATFPSGSKVRLNRIGSSGTYGSSWFRRLSIYPGLLTLDEATARL